jgi:hypothetical protein
MPTTKLTDGNGIEFKKVGMEQFDSYDDDIMLKQYSKYDKRVGALLIVFSDLEHTLDNCIAFIISDRSDDFGQRIVMDMSYMQKVELYNRLCKSYLVAYEKRAQVAKLKVLIDNLKLAGRVRNIVAHAKWMSLDEEGFVRSRAGLDDDAFVEFKYYKLTPGVLYNLERKINKIHSALYELAENNNLI